MLQVLDEKVIKLKKLFHFQFVLGIFFFVYFLIQFSFFLGGGPGGGVTKMGEYIPWEQFLSTRLTLVCVGATMWNQILYHMVYIIPTNQPDDIGRVIKLQSTSIFYYRLPLSFYTV